MTLNILVTGGAGFIGTSLCRKLLKAGHKVFSLDLTHSKVDGVESIIDNITDIHLGKREFWKHIDVCYHLAAMANVDEVRVLRKKAFDVNMYGTFNIASICQENDILLIFASTACVYGDTPQHPSTEDGPTSPMDLYGVTKLAGEDFVKLVPRWVILRFGTTVGPEQRSALATWVFLNQAHNDEPLTVTGDGKQSRNWIYVDDLVNGCVKVIENKVENEIINLVGSKTYTVNMMADMANEVVNGRNHKYEVKFIPAREGDVFKEDISIEKAKKLLGWTPKVGLKKALKRCYKLGFK
jgi:nucleoside-diphosphate-sugar epimerase